MTYRSHASGRCAAKFRKELRKWRRILAAPRATGIALVDHYARARWREVVSNVRVMRVYMFGPQAALDRALEETK